MNLASLANSLLDNSRSIFACIFDDQGDPPSKSRARSRSTQVSLQNLSTQLRNSRDEGALFIDVDNPQLFSQTTTSNNLLLQANTSLLQDIMVDDFISHSYCPVDDFHIHTYGL